MSLIKLDKPGVANDYYVHNQRYDIGHGLIFVFGSNLAGIHGAGAAEDARQKYGAKYGQGIGYTGQAYAIPTKDFSIYTLKLAEIQTYVNEFVRKTNIDIHNSFFVTAIGTGLAGYKHEQIAPMFKGAKNCWFPDVWKQYLEN